MLWLLLLRIVRERMGTSQQLCSEMLLLSGKLWPPSLHWAVWCWDREMTRSWGQMVSAGETTDVRAVGV